MRCLKLVLGAVLGLLPLSASATDGLLVFAPSSMTEAVQHLTQDYQQATGVEMKVSFAGTGQLARQIEAGAPADIFITADGRWMDWVAERELINRDTRQVIAGNRLVVAVRRETENWADVTGLLTEAPFAMGDPQSVPAGAYAKQALESIGIWDRAQGMASYNENVRVSLQRLVLGEVGAAIVYASDLEMQPNARVALTFLESTHDPIRYWAATTSTARQGAEAFMDYLLDDAAQKILRSKGFTAP